MSDAQEHVRQRADQVDVDVASQKRRRRWRLAAAAAVVVALVAAGVAIALPNSDERSGSDSTDTVVDQSSSLDVSLNEAVEFRANIVNQTGAVHLSLSDVIEIARLACGGAVNDVDQLLALGADLRGFAPAERGADSIWISARQLCPEEFADQNFESGLPFGLSEGASAPDGVRLKGLPDGFPDFIDLSVLDEQSVLWAEGRQLIVVSTTALGADEAVEYFQNGFPDGWTVNEVLGPVVDGDGRMKWSLDVDGEAWVGMVEIASGLTDDPTRTTSVTIVLAAG